MIHLCSLVGLLLASYSLIKTPYSSRSARRRLFYDPMRTLAKRHTFNETLREFMETT
jgi:hypothetical protein